MAEQRSVPWCIAGLHAFRCILECLALHERLVRGCGACSASAVPTPYLLISLSSRAARLPAASCTSSSRKLPGPAARPATRLGQSFRWEEMSFVTAVNRSRLAPPAPASAGLCNERQVAKCVGQPSCFAREHPRPSCTACINRQASSAGRRHCLLSPVVVPSPRRGAHEPRSGTAGGQPPAHLCVPGPHHCSGRHCLRTGEWQASTRLNVGC